MKRLNLILVLLFLISGCTNTLPSEEENALGEKIRAVSYDSFLERKEIKFQSTGLNIKGKIEGLAVVDTFLIGTDLRANPILHVIGASSKRYLGQVIFRGKGPGECLSVANVLNTDIKGIFWAYDISLGKLLKVDIHKALESSRYLPEKEFLLTGMARGAKSPVWISDSLFAACSYAMEDSRYFSFNTASDVQKKFGQLPPPLKNWPEQNPKAKLGLSAMAYSANMKKNPENDQVVVAYNTSDRLEIYEEGELKRIISGPEGFAPVYSFKDEGGGFLNPEYIPETQFSHMEIHVSSKYIFSLYSGEKNFQTCGKRIAVFDWDGNPVKLITLESEICSMAVMEKGDELIIYAIDEANGDLIFSKG
jgi:hypothetical protein